MDLILKCAAGVLLTVIICLFLSKQSKDISLLLAILVSVLLLCLALGYIDPVLTFIERLQTIGKLDNSAVKILLKALGICIIAEICSIICQDANNAALSKALNMLVTSVVLWMSIPLFAQLLDLFERILGTI